jgi:hypothetical protein
MVDGKLHLEIQSTLNLKQCQTLLVSEASDIMAIVSRVGANPRKTSGERIIHMTKGESGNDTLLSSPYAYVHHQRFHSGEGKMYHRPGQHSRCTLVVVSATQPDDVKKVADVIDRLNAMDEIS